MVNTSILFSDAAIQLASVVNDPSGSNRLVINEHAATIISEFPTNLAVFSICGPSGTGKSTLLNLLLVHIFGKPIELVRQQGFHTQSQAQGTTSGLWFWGTPLPLTKPDGSIVNVLLVDTEGTGKGADEITLALGAITMFSSTIFCLNVMGLPANDSLRLLATYLSLLSFNSEQARNSMSTKLYLASHDISSLVKETPEAIMAQWLVDVPGDQERNQICALLKSSFSERTFFPLLRGSEEELEALPSFKNTTTNFAKSMLSLLSSIKNGLLSPKRLNGTPFNGADVIKFVRELLTTPKELAKLPNIIQAIEKERCTRLIQPCIAIYENSWAKYTGEDVAPQEEAAKNLAALELTKRGNAIFANAALMDAAKQQLSLQLTHVGAKYHLEAQRRRQARLEKQAQEEERKRQEAIRQQAEAARKLKEAQEKAAQEAAQLQAQRERLAWFQRGCPRSKHHRFPHATGERVVCPTCNEERCSNCIARHQQFRHSPNGPCRGGFHGHRHRGHHGHHGHCHRK